LDAIVQDETITRFRPLIVQAETGSGVDLRTQATLERNRRAGQGETNGKRVVPASLVRSDEALRDTARRIITEELGIDVSYKVHQNRIFDDVEPGNAERVITISLWLFVHIDVVAPLLGGKDQVGLELVSSSAFLEHWDATTGLDTFDGVSRFGLRTAQDQSAPHRKQFAKEIWGETILDGRCDEIVFYAWRELRYGFTGRFDPFRFIGSQALDRAFRLSELRELYETVRGHKIQPDQFRRMVTGSNGFLEETGIHDASRSRPGKPAALFTLLPWAVPDRGYRP
jgi:ADP-ribose pyrophosphatase YjhB (NUDIX family)